MSELGNYRVLQAGRPTSGAMMGRMPDGQDGWPPDFDVADMDRCCAAVDAGGGTMVQPPIETADDAFSAVARDPHKARFGMAGPRGQAIRRRRGRGEAAGTPR